MIVELGEFVFDQALCVINELKENDIEQMIISVNLSPRQFRDPNLIQSIKSLLKKRQLPASCIEFEITEGLLISQFANESEALFTLHDMGIEISLDDFAQATLH